MLVTLIDNYDSFTYNLAHAFQILGHTVEVLKNDQVTVEEVVQKNPGLILVGPGPGRPSEAGISLSLIREVSGKIPLLGICLGHQAIGEIFGAKLKRGEPVHGKVSQIYHFGFPSPFQALSNPFGAVRYNSLILEEIPPDLEVTAWTEKGEVMALKHISYPIWGLQFHPESVGSDQGLDILRSTVETLNRGK